MGNGVCSRRQRRIFQGLLLLTVVCGVFYGGMMSYEMHKQLRRTEAMALKYQQHQESLSAQLQVVYEHRSRLEKSLQKERLEHKKSKEDYLSYKMEAQQSLNKEKQDSISRMNSLQVQHQILKNQHEDLKKQYYELQDQHQAQGDDHNRQLDEHRERYDKLQQIKELEVSQLKDSIFNLREENKQLRRAHHDIHTQLQDAQARHQDLKAAHDQLALNLQDHKSALAAAQVQVDEYKQLKESLNAASNQRQANGAQNPPAAPESHNPEAHKDTDVERPHKGRSHRSRTRTRWSETRCVPSRELPMEIFLHQDLSTNWTNIWSTADRGSGGLGRPLLTDCGKVHTSWQNEPITVLRRLASSLRVFGTTLRVSLLPHSSVKGLHQQEPPAERIKSSFDRRLEAQRAEERRRIHRQQEALRLQREREQRQRQERADKQEQRSASGSARREWKRTDDEAEAHHAEDEGETSARSPACGCGGRDAHLANEEEEEMKVDHKVLPPQQVSVCGDHLWTVPLQGVVDAELDPEDDPNNQGEDEFDEAEDEQLQHRPAAPAQHRDAHAGHEPAGPAVEEELVMAGNPDQQEDPVDEQYQEDLEDEAQEDVAGGQKRDAEEEDPYNEENLD
uniref:Golgi integral membrane protein 4a n=1 Tax=Tetraodon nigroviridis TaxID=99883 RepID=H3DMX3_TETNG